MFPIGCGSFEICRDVRPAWTILFFRSHSIHSHSIQGVIFSEITQLISLRGAMFAAHQIPTGLQMFGDHSVGQVEYSRSTIAGSRDVSGLGLKGLINIVKVSCSVYE
jgi:hypothetical protein